jgi:hypothetical protein
MRHAQRLDMRKSGDTLVLNDERFDFSALEEGATLPRAAIASPWIAGAVTRQDGVLHIPLILPHGPDAPHETRFAGPVTVTADGPLAVPVYDAPNDIEEDKA